MLFEAFENVSVKFFFNIILAESKEKIRLQRQDGAGEIYSKVLSAFPQKLSSLIRSVKLPQILLAGLPVAPQNPVLNLVKGESHFGNLVKEGLFS